MKKLTIVQFREAYPNDDACLDKIFQLRFGELSICPKCEKDASFARVKNRRAYQCLHCGFQLYPTANTVFEKTTTPLAFWFYAIYLQTTTRNGVAAKELERQLNVCYKTALRMAHQIKILMGNRAQPILSGIVEADETYVGGKVSNMHKSKRDSIKNKLSPLFKTPVFAVIQRQGEVVAKVMDTVDKKHLLPMLYSALRSDTRVITDASTIYTELKQSFTHDIVNHDKGEYGNGDIHTNTIESWFALLKRTIKGTHIHVSRRHLQKYVDEVTFRYIHRKEQDQMFERVLQNML